jgi:glycosyltransferase involved in cell wall biosynthesis
MPTVCWTPVDAEPLSAGLVDFFEETKARPLAMSRYGQRIFAEGGVDAAYIPHGLPLDLFKPPEDRDALREASGFAPETFIVGINQANRSGLRKALPEQVIAFARFHERHPDSKLLLQMAMAHPKGQDLPLLLSKLGVPEGVAFFPDQGVYSGGVITMEDMPAIYGGADVWMGCAMAGGFELPLLEAQACGTPVICTDASAMSELCGAGWLVSGTPFWTDGHQSWWKRPDVPDIAQAYEQAWSARESGMRLPAKPARDFAELYDADRVFGDYWVPVLAELEKRIA